MGSAAYDNAMRQFQQGQNDQDNQLLLSGRSQALQQLTAERNQPINEITALMSGSQVSSPVTGQANVPQTNVAGTDVAGMIMNNYNQQVGQANVNAQNKSQTMGGLFAGAATIAAAAF